MAEVITVALFLTLQGVLLTNYAKPPFNKNLLIGALLFVQLFFFAAFRNSEVYNDTMMYFTSFNDLKPQKLLDIKIGDHFERGYQLLENFIFLYISKNPLVLFIITSFFIQVSYMLFFVRYSKVVWFSVFLFIGFTHYFFSVSAVRQAIGIAIFNFAFYFLVNRKWLYYILLILLAAQFHSSAYLLLFLPAFSYIRLNQNVLYVFLFVVIVCFMFLKEIMLFLYEYIPKYGSVYLEEYLISESKVGTIFIIGTFLVGLIFVLKNFNFKNYTFVDQYFLLSYFAVITFWIFSLKVSTLARYGNYFMPSLIVLLSNSIFRIQGDKRRNWSYAFWVSLLIIEVAIILVYKSEWFMVSHYKFYWQ